jgi:hypothetical protein
MLLIRFSDSAVVSPRILTELNNLVREASAIVTVSVTVLLNTPAVVRALDMLSLRAIVSFPTLRSCKLLVRDESVTVIVS